MKALVYTKYGSLDCLQLKDIEKPVPADNQVLVKVAASSVNALDYRRFEMLSLMGHLLDSVLIKSIGKPLGADIAGWVEAVGSAVTQFKPGDAVFGQTKGAVGAFAEYACAAENELALKPAKLTFEDAASVPVAALTALQGLRDTGHIKAGQKVLINGASGGVGTFAVQLAKAFGAEVTAVCSTRNLDMARQIGADHVIDYTKEDFTQNNGQRYDLIAAVNGYHPLRDYRRALNSGGTYVVIGGSLPQVFQGMLLAPLLTKRENKRLASMGIAKINQKDLLTVKDLLEKGKIIPVIDRCYPLDQTVQAFHHVLEEHATGKVVISVAA